jgi:hypothetical protein
MRFETLASRNPVKYDLVRMGQSVSVNREFAQFHRKRFCPDLRQTKGHKIATPNERDTTAMSWRDQE